jgi:hypothetical protein
LDKKSLREEAHKNSKPKDNVLCSEIKNYWKSLMYFKDWLGDALIYSVFRHSFNNCCHDLQGVKALTRFSLPRNSA